MIQADRLVLIDLGSVKTLEIEEQLHLSQTMTATGEVIGTPQYMSPEQFDRAKGKVSAASDVYSLGITLFELLTGKLPLYGSTFLEYGNAHLHIIPHLVSEHNSAIPPWFAQLIANMLKKRPVDRCSIENIRMTINQNRADTIVALQSTAKQMMADVYQMMDSQHQSISQETEKKVLGVLSQLQTCLTTTVVPEVQKNLIQFIADTKIKIDAIKTTPIPSHTTDLIGFDPNRCPNLLCHAPRKYHPMSTMSSILENAMCVQQEKIYCLPRKPMSAMLGRSGNIATSKTTIFIVDHATGMRTPTTIC